MMKSVHKWRLLLAAAMLLLPVYAGQAVGKQTPNKQARLSSEEHKVIKYLLADWGEDYSVTSVDIAMAALKMKPSDEARFRIGSHIKAHPELHETIRRWGWVTLVLTPDEKLTDLQMCRSISASSKIRPSLCYARMPPTADDGLFYERLQRIKLTDVKIQENHSSALDWTEETGTVCPRTSSVNLIGSPASTSKVPSAPANLALAAS